MGTGHRLMVKQDSNMKLLTTERTMEIINAELKYCGKTFSDVESDPKWYHNNTMTQAQHAEWIAWLKQYLSSELKWPKWMVREKVPWIDLMWGLRVSDPE